jgi:hypothetical protein
MGSNTNFDSVIERILQMTDEQDSRLQNLADSAQYTAPELENRLWGRLLYIINDMSTSGTLDENQRRRIRIYLNTVFAK